MRKLTVRFILLYSCLLIYGCTDCGYEKVQVINGLKNYQSVIGFVRNCGATTSESINVMFIKPEMNLGRGKTDIFTAELSMKLFLEKVSEDTVKIIFCALDDRIIRQEKEVHGIHFIYENNCKYFNKK
jgi:hypothetical protein